MRGMQGPRDELWERLSQCKSDEKPVSRFCNQDSRAATKPPRHPTAIPPNTTRRHSSTERKRIVDKLMADANGTRYLARREKNAIPSASNAISAPTPPCSTPS